MKKCIAFCLAVVLFIGTVLAYNGFLDNAIIKRKSNLRYSNTNAKLQCITALAKDLDPSTMLVLGSSELNPAKEASYPGNLLANGNSDFNMTFVGYGNYCSLQHSIYLGSLAKNIPNKKVVLILSPQWFETNYLSSDSFSARFTQRAFDEFMKNDEISKDTKQKIIRRCETLLAKDPTEQANVKLYDSVYLKGSPNLIDRLYLLVNNVFQEVKTKRDVIRYVQRDKPFVNPQVRAENIDFNQLMASEEQEGKANSTNNPLYIDDTYYNTQVVPMLASTKNSETGKTFCVSTEYDDLRLFLQVCKETGIQPLLVSVPVNGYWYDYMNFSKADRQQYYQNIRDIAAEYNVSLADFSSEEYTKYFFKDIWHIGWKGWTALDKRIYDFYKEDDTSYSQ